MARLAAGGAAGPATTYLRTAPRFKTASADHGCLVRSLFGASGVGHSDSVVLSIFEVP